jgi:alcohol dehydrogenase (cytochrome c)
MGWGQGKRLIQAAIFKVVHEGGSMGIRRKAVLGVALASVLLMTLPAICQNYQPVTDQRLTKPDPQDWLQYRRTYDGQGHSPLKQVNVQNVKNLVPVWTFSTGTNGGHQAAVIENSGIMYVTAAYNKLYALDVKSGKLLWKYERDIPEKALSVVCCDVVNRGVALYDNKVYMGTIDAHIVAFDALTGKVMWDSKVADYHDGITITGAPLAYKGKIITGMTGGEFGARGRLTALDAETGKIVWQTYTIPAPGEPGSETWPEGDAWKTGGGTTWSVGAIDPKQNLIYWGTGNPGPWAGDVRPGDNLYSVSTVAFDADTGAIKMHYQYVPHDLWDYDNITPPVLVNVNRNGKMVEGIFTTHKHGYDYLLDRTDMKFIYAEPIFPITAFDSVDPKTGRPHMDPAKDPSQAEVDVCPSFLGGTNWMPLSYDATLNYMFVPGNDWCETIKDLPEAPFEKGKAYVRAQFKMKPAPDALGAGGVVQAIDVKTGKVAWKKKFEDPIWSGTLSTDGGLVFVGGTASRNFMAMNSKSGDILWKFPTNSGITGVPTTFEVGGTQYVAVVSGFGGAIPLWTGPIHEKYTKDVPQGGVIWVFALRK